MVWPILLVVSLRWFALLAFGGADSRACAPNATPPVASGHLQQAPRAGFRSPAWCDSVNGAMTRLRKHATSAAVAVAVLLAVGSTASLSTQARTAAGHGGDRSSVDSAAFGIGAAALRQQRPGLHPVVGRGGQGGWRVPTAGAAAAALLAAVSRRHGRRARGPTRHRGQLPLPGLRSRAPPALQPG
jgi:hypothetical protein